VKRAILFAVVAFVLSLGGTTAVMVKRAPHAQVAVAATPKDSTAANPGAAGKPADSTAHPKAAADSGKILKDSASTRDSVARPPASGAQAAPVVKAAAPAPLVPRPTPRVGPDPVARQAAVKQVARVLSAMKAAEAAKVLAFLSDDEVEGILRSVGPRQAADFMTNLPKERAATLSRRLMVPKPQEQSR
jgi:hypothetical protein